MVPRSPSRTGRFVTRAEQVVRTAGDWLDRFRSSQTVPVFHDQHYRLPLTSVQGLTGFEPRRPDLVLWYLQDHKLLPTASLYSPTRIGYDDLCRVHTPRWLEALGQPEALAQVFGLPAWDINVDSLFGAVRAACGGTLAAARAALAGQQPALNLAGGFHHARPDGGGGFCAVNDIAVALAVLRSSGFAGTVAVLDLDAHPPDGTAACFAAMGEQAFIGSLSGCNWGIVPGVDETVLPSRTADGPYLQALSALLQRMPAADLTFVVAGGDVLASDPLGGLGLTLTGAAQRDLLVARALAGRASVWLPAGGYSQEAWKVLLGTALVLLRDRLPTIGTLTDPLARRFRNTSKDLAMDQLSDWQADVAEIERDLGIRRDSDPRLLDFYTAEGLEYALQRYGVLGHLTSLGYTDLRVTLGRTDVGDRMLLTGRFAQTASPAEAARAASSQSQQPEVLVEAVLERQPLPPAALAAMKDHSGDKPAADQTLVLHRSQLLFVHWLTLRHPRGAFASGRPQLPGQEVPGLGMAREAGELLARIADRLGLAGVALRPAWFHVAFAARYRMRFVDTQEQGQFLALLRDLRQWPSLQTPEGGFALVQASRLLAEGQVGLSQAGQQAVAYVWPAGLMMDAADLTADAAEVAAVAANSRFVPLQPVSSVP